MKKVMMRLVATAAALGLLVGCGPISSLPGGGGSMTGESYLVVDTHSDYILGAANAGAKRPIASLAKVATAVVVLDWATATGQSLAQPARVPASALQLGGPNPFGLQAGDLIPLRDAMFAAMMGSDNISAQTLATHVGASLLGGRGGDPVGEFVSQMNALASKRGMTRTRFVNAHGLDNASTGYSTAEDMARLMLHANAKPGFTFYTSQKSRSVSYQRAGQSRSFTVKNTNQLLGTQGVKSGKTGTTLKAGQCLVATASRASTVRDTGDGNKLIVPNEIMVVVLGSNDRFTRAAGLLRQGWAEYESWHAQGRPHPGQSKVLKTQ